MGEMRERAFGENPHNTPLYLMNGPAKNDAGTGPGSAFFVWLTYNDSQQIRSFFYRKTITETCALSNILNSLKGEFFVAESWPFLALTSKSL